jgi:hypothetical protein
MDKLQEIKSIINGIFEYWKEQWDFIIGKPPKLICEKIIPIPKIGIINSSATGIQLNNKSSIFVKKFLKNMN